uniref:Uncharacterized protein n=1 Tax=Aureoumbra lagunensis TaxID=44058 RepID=A0A7S3K2I0_9STRA
MQARGVSENDIDPQIWPMNALSSTRESERSRPSSTKEEIKKQRQLRRIHNEYRDAGVSDSLLSLWPERYDEERVNSIRLEAILDLEEMNVIGNSSSSPLHEEAHVDAREGVRNVLIKHLESFENGYVTLSEALRTTKHYINGEWRFEAGDLVEYRGLDLRWHLGYIIVSTGDALLDKQHSDHGGKLSGKSEEIGYAVVATEGFRAGFGVTAAMPRPSSKMLRALFGPTPFRLQQQLLLEAENRAVHRRSSPADFQAVCWKDWAHGRWHAWLNDTENSSFRHFHDVDVSNDGARIALYNLIMEPFAMMDEINDWELDKEKLSPYLYFACLGSGLLLSIIVLLIQVGTAATLFAFQVQKSATKSQDLEDDNRRAWARHDGFWPCRPNSDQGPHLSSIMVTLIAVYYLFKIVPDMFTAVTGVMGFGSSDPGVAKLVNLRRLISISDEDTLKMKIGFRIYLTLNTAFDCSLYILNLYLLWLTRDAVEILLNSLAIEFIQSLDESFCTSTWFDPHGRYIKASAFEMILRQFLDVHAIENQFYPKPQRSSSFFQSTNIKKNESTTDQSHPLPPPKRTTNSHFVRNQLDSQLIKLYGDDQGQKRTIKKSTFRAFFF